jgi:hypothetical protein
VDGQEGNISFTFLGKIGVNCFFGIIPNVLVKPGHATETSIIDT